MSRIYGHCWFCAAPIWDDEDPECPYCGIQLDGEDWRDGPGYPYDDEAELAYSDKARGEETAPAVDPAYNNPRYPPRHG